MNDASDPPFPAGWRVTDVASVANRMLRARAAADAMQRVLPAARTFTLTAFQEAAVATARERLRRWGGVLVADDVGLGKTYIGLTLAELTLRDGGAVAVIAPAALRAHWLKPLRRLARARRLSGVAEPGRDGMPDEPNTNGAALWWLSHTRLSISGFDGAAMPPRLVVVDEAHAFRNPATRRYRALARLCTGADVVLLTATPVNNSLLDLYALIRLFAADGAFRTLGVPDLRTLFGAAAIDAAPPAALAVVLRAVVVRRTRAMLREAPAPGSAREDVPMRATGSGPEVETTTPLKPLRFPARAPPVVIRYTLGSGDPGLLHAIAAFIEEASFAPFDPRPRADGDARAAGALIRLMLLKRLESSAAALRATLGALIRFYNAFLGSLADGRVVTPRDGRALFGTDDPTATQLVLEALVLEPALPILDRAMLHRAATADLARMRELRRRLITCGPDPKLAALTNLLDGPLANRKVLLFTEFRETATYLARALAARGGIGLIHGGGAWLGGARAGRRVVVERFAPAAAGVAAPHPREAVCLLIATDVLAEGMNLQDAAHVVSYDLPWNPVRLIQRIGRVDRLGTRHTAVHSYAFLPEDALETLLGLVARLRRKLHAIDTGIGLDAPVLTAADPVGLARTIDRLAAGDATLFDELERGGPLPLAAPVFVPVQCESFPADTTADTAGPPLFAVCSNTGSAIAPGAGGSTSAPAARDGVLVLGCWLFDGNVRWTWSRPDGRAIEDEHGALLRIDVLLKSGSRAATHPPDDPAIRSALAAAATLLRAGGSAAGHAAALPAGSPAARIARRLLAALSSRAPLPDDPLLPRADAVLERLARGVPAGADLALKELVGGPALPATRLLAAVELALVAVRGRPPRALAPGPVPIAAIVFAAPSELAAAR